jgi:hypothetical protein
MNGFNMDTITALYDIEDALDCFGLPLTGETMIQNAQTAAESAGGIFSEVACALFFDNTIDGFNVDALHLAERAGETVLTTFKVDRLNTEAQNARAVADAVCGYYASAAPHIP